MRQILCISSDAWKSCSFEQMKSENELFYQDILPQNYGKSFANPAFAVQELGEEFGRILSFYIRNYVLRELLFSSKILKRLQF